MIAPELRTARLALSPVVAADVDRLLAHWGHPAVARWLFDGRAPARETVSSLIDGSLAAARAHGYALWRVAALHGRAFLGVCGIRDGAYGPDMLYSLEPDARGHGYAHEASSAALDHCFRTLAVAVVHATVDAGNRESVAVLDRLGFTPRASEAGQPLCYELDASAWHARAACA